MSALPRLRALRYLQPLREGGSLPAVVETEDGLFVAKFRGAGQGPRALLAELVVGLLALEAGLPVPEPALLDVSGDLAADQRDPEVRELVEASAGMNVGLRYLDGAFNFDPAAAGDLIDGAFASAVVWLDALVTNPDRSARNPNLMVWQRRPWLIDHGAALYAHHAWEGVDAARTRTPFPAIRDHVLLPRATALEAADRRLAERLEPAVLEGVVARLPEELLMDPLARGAFASAEEARARYLRYLSERVAPPRAFAVEAERARVELLAHPPQALGVRR